MLDQNSSLSCPGETDFMFDYGKLSSGVTKSSNHDKLLRDRIFLNYCKNAGIDPTVPRSMTEMVETMAGQKDGTDQTAVLMLHRNLPQMLAQAPEMKILHLIRDPRDVARSSIGMGWAGSTYYGVRHWINTEREWAKMAKNMAPEQVLEIRYETLIQEPAETLNKICLFFGVPFHPSMLEYDQGSSYSKPDTSMIYQWRRKQSPREIGLVEAQAKPLMHTLGYEPSGHPLVHPSALGRLTLAIGQRRATWGTRIKRFGLRDSLLVVISRRLKIPVLGHAAQGRIDEKTVKHLK
jgi:hypothetical protein